MRKSEPKKKIVYPRL